MRGIMSRRTLMEGAAALAGSFMFLDGGVRRAGAAGETLRALADESPNTFDPAGLGYNRTAMKISLNLYDRLVTFETRKLENGALVYDYSAIKPELAESWETSADGRSTTVRIRKDATFHDGQPVTAEDVKWSLDRGVSVPVAKGQAATGSMTSTDQFVVVDSHTIRIDTARPDRRTLANLAFPFFPIFNSKLAKQHAAEGDPWATSWLQRNPAGGGAFKLESFAPGQNIILVRNEDWKSGALPSFSRIVEQVVPEAANRRAALEKGECDLAFDLPPRDVREMESAGVVKIVSTPITNNLTFVAMNSKAEPFDDVRVRQAVAYALPYQALFDNAQQGRGTPMFGAAEDAQQPAEYPVPSPYKTDYEKAKALLAEAGHPNGFQSTISFDIGNADAFEPASILIQESLAKVGITLSIDKLTSGQFGSAVTKRELPLFIEASVSWIADPDYYFEITYGTDWRFNFGNYKNPELDSMLAEARWETDPAKYDALIRQMTALVFEDIPLIPLWLASFDIPMGKDIDGFAYFYHRRVDYRSLERV